MNGPSRDIYIPTGCLLVTRQNAKSANFAPSLWDGPLSTQWRAIADVATSTPGDSSIRGLDIQHLLFDALPASTFSLINHQWVWLQFRLSIDDPDVGILRIYLLPDDVDRRRIDRSQQKLRNARLALFSLLDFSNDLWQGKSRGVRRSAPKPFGSAVTSSPDMSLLEMFNDIPSPMPRPEQVCDDAARDAVESLLQSRVAGLKTTLHPYQRRSAAVMLQREAGAGQVLDPRLSHVVDQHGNGWYYDGVTGSVLREPRYYSSISGGILAEEMGAGKTVICLSLILATRHLLAEAPEFLERPVPVRNKTGSLMDMAAATATRHSVPWGLHFDAWKSQQGYEYAHCLGAIRRNPGVYLLPRQQPRRQSRHLATDLPPEKMFLSNASLIVVPNNLVRQWMEEIAKHTTDLRVLTLTRSKEQMPQLIDLLSYDVVLFAQRRFEKLIRERLNDRNGQWIMHSPLAHVHFKRCIIDEGHRLGNSRIGNKSNLLLVLDCLQISARWIVTGTPSQGLFGLDKKEHGFKAHRQQKLGESSGEQERRDLERIGSITTLYLKARPWTNTVEEGETPAEWGVYVLQPRHSARSSGRKDCIQTTLESVIIRHRRSEIGDLLPPVEEKVVLLDGCYQDILSLNLFSMMIIFNSVQSQRTDQDYFFHSRQRKSLMQLVHNLRQSSFFGGSFFSKEDIKKSVETAETFLAEKKVEISRNDEEMLRQAIALAHVACDNHLKSISNMYQQLPVYAKDLPGGQAWSLDGVDGEEICTDATMLTAFQKAVKPHLKSPHGLKVFLKTGKFAEVGKMQRDRMLDERAEQAGPQTNAMMRRGATLAGNTKLGEDKKSTGRSRPNAEPDTTADDEADAEPDAIPDLLTKAQLIATASAKLSYLLDAVVKHQDEEQIIIFYENENVAYYLAVALEILQIHHLIYARGITTERRSRYVATFNENPKFRVLLMDISQAAFGLDMRSASRLYFISPVLNPQVEAQAIGRVRRISQKRQVSVETLVLRGSLEEVIMERRQRMTQAEHRRCKSILDDRPIYNWILNARILPLPEGGPDGPSQMAGLQTPQYIFGRGLARDSHPDEDLVMTEHEGRIEHSLHKPDVTIADAPAAFPIKGTKRRRSVSSGKETEASADRSSRTPAEERPARRVRFAE